MDVDSAASVIRFANVEIDFDGHRLRVDGKTWPLEPKAFAVLALLARRPGHLFTREEILDAVWGHFHVSPGVLNRIASLLRQALGENAQQPRWLHTVHGVGYRLDLPEDLTIDAPAAQKAAPQAVSSERAPIREPLSGNPAAHGITAPQAVIRRTRAGRRGLLLILLTTLAIGASWQVWRMTVHAADPALPDKTHRPTLTTVAVLLLANTSGDPSQQFFADGISDNLIDTLSKFDGLKVIGRISSFRFRDSHEDIEAIGAQLGVAFIISGNVQHAGNSVRIGVDLISTTDGHTVWAEHYDRPYQNLFALQDEITHAVAVALRAKLRSPDDASNQGDRPPTATSMPTTPICMR